MQRPLEQKSSKVAKLSKPKYDVTDLKLPENL